MSVFNIFQVHCLDSRDLMRASPYSTLKRSIKADGIHALKEYRAWNTENTQQSKVFALFTPLYFGWMKIERFFISNEFNAGKKLSEKIVCSSRQICEVSESTDPPITMRNNVIFIENIRGPRVQLFRCRSLFPYSLAQYNDSICSWLALLAYTSVVQMRHHFGKIFRSAIFLHLTNFQLKWPSNSKSFD